MYSDIGFAPSFYAPGSYIVDNILQTTFCIQCGNYAGWIYNQELNETMFNVGVIEQEVCMKVQCRCKGSVKRRRMINTYEAVLCNILTEIPDLDDWDHYAIGRKISRNLKKFQTKWLYSYQ
jgi:hypothetical protein